jgi:hypothetical protein
MAFYQVGDYVKVPTNLAAEGYARYENRIYRCVRAGETVPSNYTPAYDTTVGNTTEELAPATGVLTLTGNAQDGETVTLDEKVYTFQDTLTDVDGNVQIGSDALESLANLAAAINLDAGAGVAYADEMTLHPTVEATADEELSQMTVTAKVFGAEGNSIVTTETLDDGLFGASTLGDGITGAAFIAEEAWSRHAVITQVTSRKLFRISVSEARAVDRWFNGGVLTFESGDNAGKAIEVKSWTQSNGEVEVYLPLAYLPEVGNRVWLYRGCDKSVPTCRDVFDNILNMRAEPYVPGQDKITRYESQ